MRFKESKAYVKVDEAGRPIVEDGRVEIRYRPDDERSYRASPANLRELDDPPPATASAAAPPPAASEGAPPKTPKKKPAARGPVVEAWTDGACSGNPGEAGLGVILKAGGRRLEVSRYLGRATNNIAELTAIQAALGLIKNKRAPVRVFTDSAYALGVLTRGWKAKKNPELVEAIRAELETFARVEFVKVEGHAGVSENERADQLARMAILTRKNSEKRSTENEA
ncbi:MAG: ribonuclease HI [Myxococcales bacterium]|nr:MAG: ribonuclease HI [Myxococcales bacterium]